MAKDKSVHFRISGEDFEKIQKFSIEDGRKVASLLSSWVSLGFDLERTNVMSKLEKLAEQRGTSVHGFITSLIRSL